MNGWLFDLYPLNSGKMVVWLKSCDGRAIRLEDSWKPSLFIAGPEENLDHLSRFFQKKFDTRFEERFEKISDHSKSKILRVRVPSPRALPEVARRVLQRDSGVKVYNLDVPVDQVYLYEKDIFPLALLEANVDREQISWSVKDSVEKVDYEIPDLKTVSLEVEVEKRSRLPDFKDPVKKIVLEFDDRIILDSGSETEKLLALSGIVQEKDPDIVVTSKGDSFQIPYLTRRSLVNGILSEFQLGRDPSYSLETLGRRSGKSYFSYGRVYYRPMPKRIYGRLHLDESNSFLYGDCGFEGLAEIARTCRIPLHRASRSTIGTSMTSIQLYNAFRSDCLIPWRKSVPEDFKTARELLQADRGGLVFEPRVGLFSHVGELDFSSLYPTLMWKRNLSPETVRCKCCPESQLRVPELNYNICEKRTGIVPKSLQLLLEKRQAYKNLLKQSTSPGVYKKRADALKWILVCCLSPQSPVLIRRRGLLEYTRIGPFIDSLVGKKLGIINCPEDLYVAGLGSDLKSSFQKVGKLIKVPSPKNLLQLEMENGRHVTCTANHLFFILRKGSLAIVSASDLKRRDLIPVGKGIASKPEDPETVNLLSFLLKILDENRLRLWRVKGDWLKDHIKESKRKLLECRRLEGRNLQLVEQWYTQGQIPLSYYHHLRIREDKTRELRIGRGRDKGGRIAWLPSILPVNCDLGFFLGLYVADGSYGENFIRIDIGENEKDILRRLQEIVRRLFGLPVRIYKEKRARMFVAQIDSASLVFLMKEIFGLGGSSSSGKLRVPKIVLNGSPEVILGFLSGLIAGDGTVSRNRNVVLILSHKYDFIEELGYLALKAHLSYGINRGGRLHRITFSGPSLAMLKGVFLKKNHLARLERMDYSCAQHCNHATYEQIPVKESGLEEIARLARTIRTPRMDKRIRTCPLRVSRSLERIEKSPWEKNIDKAFIGKLLQADVGFTPLKKIKRVPTRSRFVYCFQIADGYHPAFFTGCGAVLTHNCFGYLGFKNARFGKIDAHIAVCAFARQVLLESARLASESGFRLLHGLVDSLWLESEQASEQTFQDFAKRLEQRLDLPVSFEGIYRWIMFLPSKIRTALPVLNRYFGVFQDGKIKARGIALRRHDTPLVVKRCQEEMLLSLAQARDEEEFRRLLPEALKILRNYLGSLASADPEDLVVSKTLSKNPSEYTHRVPQAIAAQKLQAEGARVSAGETVGFLFTRGPGSRSLAVPSDLYEGSEKIDLEKYRSLLLRSASELFSPLGYDLRAISQAATN